MRTGQVEIIAIVAIIVVAIVVILYAALPTSDTEPVSLEGKSVRNSLTSLIQAAAQESLRTTSTYGGYTDAQADGVAFLGDSVPYWQTGGVVSAPPAKQNFVQATEDFINENKDAYVADLGDVEVGEANVVANFLGSKIDLTVNLPSTFNGQPLPGSYSLSIPTKFGDILSFADEFSREQAQKRFFEIFILGSMLLSPIENGEHTTPLFISLSECGDSVFLSYPEVSEAVEDRVKVTLGHTYLSGRVPLQVGDITSYPKYPLPEFTGDQDLDVTFHLPDDFDLTPSSMQFSPNPIIAIAEPVEMTSHCVSDPLYISYFLNFPMIVRAKDPITGNVFQFAHQVFIKDNAPGPWTDPAVYEQSIQSQVCETLDCSLSLSVTSLSGTPVDDASVSFMGCSLGRTDLSGTLTAPTPCGLGPIQVLKSGYAVTTEMYSSSDFSSPITITAPKMLNAEVFVYQVTVDDSGSLYTIKEITTIPDDRRLLLTLNNLGKEGTNIVYGAAGKLSNVPAGDVGATATLTNDVLQVNFGQVSSFQTIPEDTPELHIYVPSNILFSSLSSLDASNKALDYADLFASCGIAPLSTTPVSIDDVVPCVRGYDEI